MTFVIFHRIHRYKLFPPNATLVPGEDFEWPKENEIFQHCNDKCTILEGEFSVAEDVEFKCTFKVYRKE